MRIEQRTVPFVGRQLLAVLVCRLGVLARACFLVCAGHVEPPIEGTCAPVQMSSLARLSGSILGLPLSATGKKSQLL